MKKKRFSVKQIAAILKQAEPGRRSRSSAGSMESRGRAITGGRSYGGIEPSVARELKQLRKENTRLKRLVADLPLDKVMLQDVLRKEF